MLLDTKGTILLYDGKAKEALPFLQRAVSSATASNPDPRYCFHLALAYDRLGENRKARDALTKARQEGLTDQFLTPTDRRLLADFERKPQPSDSPDDRAGQSRR